MNAFVKVLPKMKKFEQYIEDVKKANFPISLSGLSESQKAHFIYATRFYAEKPVVVVTYNEIERKKLLNDLQFFQTEDILVFPKREVVYYDIDTMNKDVSMERLNVFSKLYLQEAGVILTTIEALMQKTLPKLELFSKVIYLEVGATISLEQLKEQLNYLGYERTDMVEGRGQYSVRGGIVDVFPLTTKCPIRIEFWGDEIDSIRYFDAISQRSIDTISNATILPVEEFLVDSRRLEEIGNAILQKYPHCIEDVEAIKNGNYLNKVQKYFEFFYEHTTSLFDYFSKDTILFVDEPVRLKSKCQSIEFENKELMEQYLEKYKVLPSYTNCMASFSEVAIALEDSNTISLERMNENMHAKRNGYSFNCREVGFFRGAVDLFIQEVQEARANEKRILILGGGNAKCKSIATMLLEHQINTQLIVSQEDDFLLRSFEVEAKNVPVMIMPGSLSNGFEYEDLNLIVASGEGETPLKETKRSYKPKAFQEGKKVVFADLKVGDYVVHSTHGIGQYIGMHTLEVDNIRKDYMKIQYKDNDVLYIPTNQLENIRKYMAGGEEAHPKLNKLGSKDFEKTKAKVKASLRDIAKGLVELYAKRRQQVGYKFSKDTVWQTQFEEMFPYEETPDQLRCIEEVKRDMESEKPMDRLLCGDVGYGKTEVAIRAAFKAVMDGKQVAYLVPTTVLAEQQFKSFSERMKDFPVKVAVLNRFRTLKEKKAILQKLKTGEMDILIGTHRIIQKDVVFKDLGLLIIDEEQRFGVTHKEKIKQLKSNVDVLTMTATPIPRTLHMSIVGIRDMSVIYDPPQNRKPIQTYVLEYDADVIKEAILKEMERGGQVFYLYNRVESIEEKASMISRLIPEARVSFANGQMTGKEIESIMADFVQKKIDILVCTTILESGIDIPNANTIIIEDADRLGLAQLYQIRGRVGRSDRAAYAYITYRKNKILSEVSEKRLKAIKEFTEFGSGFKIALRDLEIRGAGNILGPEQHGHMEAVGYEMYCKLLEEAVKEVQGQEVEKEWEVTIDLKVSAYIPNEYISHPAQKIETYQDIANIEKEEQISEMVDELIDRYGEMPNEMFQLLEIARIKCYARKERIMKIEQKGNKILFYFLSTDKLTGDVVSTLIEQYKNKLFFSRKWRNLCDIKVAIFKRK